MSVRPSVQLSCKHKASLTDEPKLIKLVLYNLRMCMKGIILVQTISREIISSVEQGKHL